MTDKPHYVILSVDALADTFADDSCLRAPSVGEWTLTEDDDGYDYDYLADECGDERYRDGRHRKWVASLSDAELDAWLDAEGYADREDARSQAEPTMGMITELGWLPAYCLRDEPMDWNMGGITQVIDRCAYVGEYALAGDLPADARDALSSLYGIEEDR